MKVKGKWRYRMCGMSLRRYSISSSVPSDSPDHDIDLYFREGKVLGSREQQDREDIRTNHVVEKAQREGRKRG